MTNGIADIFMLHTGPDMEKNRAAIITVLMCKV